MTLTTRIIRHAVDAVMVLAVVWSMFWILRVVLAVSLPEVGR